MSKEEVDKVPTMKTIVIQVHPKKVCQQGVRDNGYMEERRVKNRDKYFSVRNKLFSLFGCNAKRLPIKKLGESMSKIINVKFDRLAKRTTDGSIFWFCENWDKLEPIIDTKYNLHDKNKTVINNDEKPKQKQVEKKEETRTQNGKPKADEFFTFEESPSYDWEDITFYE